MEEKQPTTSGAPFKLNFTLEVRPDGTGTLDAGERRSFELEAPEIERLQRSLLMAIAGDWTATERGPPPAPAVDLAHDTEALFDAAMQILNSYSQKTPQIVTVERIAFDRLERAWRDFGKGR